jgi:hypothetical protein
VKQIRRLLTLTSKECYLLIEALFLLIIFRLMLVTLPFHQIARFLKLHSGVASIHEHTTNTNTNTTRIISWAIDVITYYSTNKEICLAQALTGRSMLLRRGYRPTLFIGIAKDQQGNFLAHAWLTCQNTIVTGRKGMWQFKVISTFI